MSAQHTPGTIRYYYEPHYCHGELIASNGAIVARFIGEPSKDNARRLVACWNACEGISTEALENITLVGDTLASRFQAQKDSEDRVSAQRDELLEALKALTNSLDEHDLLHDDQRLAFGDSLAAIAKATGEKQ